MAEKKKLTELLRLEEVPTPAVFDFVGQRYPQYGRIHLHGFQGLEYYTYLVLASYDLKDVVASAYG